MTVLVNSTKIKPHIEVTMTVLVNSTKIKPHIEVTRANLIFHDYKSVESS